MLQIYNHYQYYYSILADVERPREGTRRRGGGEEGLGR